MSVALDAPFLFHIEATEASWPLCAHCSKRLQRPFRVEVLGMLGRERPKELRDKCRVIVEVECHGARQEFALEHAAWWSEAHFHNALGKLACFVKDGTGAYTTKKLKGHPVK